MNDEIEKEPTSQDEKNVQAIAELRLGLEKLATGIDALQQYLGGDTTLRRSNLYLICGREGTACYGIDTSVAGSRMVANVSQAFGGKPGVRLYVIGLGAGTWTYSLNGGTNDQIPPALGQVILDFDIKSVWVTVTTAAAGTAWILVTGWNA